MRNRGIINTLKFLVSIIVCQLAGYIGSIFVMPAIGGPSGSWYAGLKKPSFSPPNWVFSPVWTLLFLLMGIALFLVWKKEILAEGKGTAIFVFLIQLVLNVLWSLFFFGFRSPLSAFIEIIALLVMVLFTIAVFRKISEAAAWLLLPYALWIVFAGVLNFSIFLLN